jgi:hypothetical protein
MIERVLFSCHFSSVQPTVAVLVAVMQYQATLPLDRSNVMVWPCTNSKKPALVVEISALGAM